MSEQAIKRKKLKKGKNFCEKLRKAQEREKTHLKDTNGKNHRTKNIINKEIHTSRDH